MWGLELAVIAGMVALNGVFAGYEIALASVSAGRLDVLAREGRRGAAAAHRMKGSMEASLAVVQMGVTLAGMLAAAVGGAGAEETVEPLVARLGFGATATQALAIAAVVVPLTAVTIVFGELVPKVFSLRNKEAVCLALSPAMEWFGLAVWPAVWLFEKSTLLITSLLRRPASKESLEAAEEAMLQEIRAAANVARTGRLIGAREEGIIVGASELPDTSAREAMLPAEHISLLDLDAPIGESLLRAHDDMHTRFPVTSRHGDPQGIVGYVNFKDIVAVMRMSPDRPDLRGIVRPLPEFDPDMPLSQCLEAFIGGHTHIALVREPAGSGDEAGRVIGLMTLEDVLEEFVGDIRDEYDRLPTYVTPAGPSWIVGGGATLRSLYAATRLLLPGTAEDGTADEGKTEAETVADESGRRATDGSESADDSGIRRRPDPLLHAWMEERLGRRVRGGDVIRADGVRVLARKVRRGMLLEALVGREAGRG